jgi:lysylphosphatidylglycerol synthetase-like protein (DUF2156 family)
MMSKDVFVMYAKAKDNWIVSGDPVGKSFRKMIFYGSLKR